MFRDLLDQLGEEWVPRSRQNESVVDAGGVGGRCQEWNFKKGIQIHETGDVHVEVDAAVVMQQKVAEDVGPLDCLAVPYVGLVHFRSVVERILLLRVVFADPIGGVVFCPEQVCPIGVQRHAALACGLVLLEPIRTVAAVEVVLIEKNLMHDFGREVNGRRLTISESGWSVRRVVDEVQLQLWELDVCANALDEVADMRNGMVILAAPDREAEYNGEDQQGVEDVADMHFGSSSDG